MRPVEGKGRRAKLLALCDFFLTTPKTADQSDSVFRVANEMSFVRPDPRKKSQKPPICGSSRLTLMGEAGCERSLSYGLKEVEMKRCPTCRQLFSDTAFRFCRSDGTPLVSELVPLGDAPTILFSTTRISDRFPWLVSESRPTCDEHKSESEITGGLR